VGDKTDNRGPGRASTIRQNASQLAKVAVDAFKRLPPAGEREHVGDDVLVCIVFAAMAAEAYLFDLEAVGKHLLRNQYVETDAEPAIEELVRYLETAEAASPQHGVRKKYRQVRKILSGSAYKESEDPFLSFHILLNVRNAIAHLRADRIDVLLNTPDGVVLTSPPPLFDGWNYLLKQGVLYETGDSGGPVIGRVQTVACARWALAAARAMIASVSKVMPCASLRFEAEHFLLRRFDVGYPSGGASCRDEVSPEG
jgi:hypothetical protein